MTETIGGKSVNTDVIYVNSVGIYINSVVVYINTVAIYRIQEEKTILISAIGKVGLALCPVWQKILIGKTNIKENESEFIGYYLYRNS